MSNLMINSDSLDFGSTVSLVLKSGRSFKLPVHRKPKKGCISVRFYLAFLSLLGCVMLYITRVNLSVTIVAMVNETNNQNNGNDSNIELSCNRIDSKNWTNKSSFNIEISKQQLSSGEFTWSQPTQGIILGSFDYGYICLQIVGGRLAEVYGAKWICGIAILLSGLINIATPFIARYNLYAFIASRIILGLSQSAVYPSLYALFNRWIPHNERSTYLPWLDAGCLFGTIIAMGGAGELIALDVLGGWPMVFYMSGICTIIWFIPWSLYVTSDPRDHRWISQEELSHIMANTDEPKSKLIKRVSVPWLQIFKSKAFLSVCFTKFMLNCSFTLLLLKMPTYLEDVIGFTIDENGLINSLIYSGNAISLLFGGYIADMIINKSSLSKTTVRKIFEATAGYLMAVIFILIPIAGCDKLTVTTLLTIAGSLLGLSSGGDIPIVSDMTSEYPATVFAVMNGISTINGFLTPYIVGLIINANPHSIKLWSYCFYYASSMSVLGVSAFVLFASANKQKWG